MEYKNITEKLTILESNAKRIYTIKTIPIIEHVASKKKSIEEFSFVFPK